MQAVDECHMANPLYLAKMLETISSVEPSVLLLLEASVVPQMLIDGSMQLNLSVVPVMFACCCCAQHSSAWCLGRDLPN